MSYPPSYPRVREEDLTTTPITLTKESWNPGCNAGINNCPCSPYVNGQTSYTLNPVIGYKSMHDFVVPYFHSRKAAGEIFNNPMEQVLYKLEDEPTVTDFSQLYLRNFPCGVTGGKWLLRGSTDYGLMPSSVIINRLSPVFAPPPDLDVEVIKNRCILEMYSRVTSASVGTLECLAEIKKTISLITGIIGKIVKILIALKRLDMSMLAKSINLKDFAKARLELRFGLNPLVKEMYAAVEVLSGNNTLRTTFRGKEQESGETVLTQTLTSSSSSEGSTLNFVRNFTKTTKREVTVRAGMLTTLSSNLALEFGLDKVPETAWELVPYSFLVDKFIKVGNWIAAWTPNIGVRTLASWVVVTDEIVSTTELTSQSSSYTLGAGNQLVDMHWRYANCKLTETKISKYRSPNPSRPVLPQWDLSFNLDTLMDLVAIMRQHV